MLIQHSVSQVAYRPTVIDPLSMCSACQAAAVSDVVLQRPSIGRCSWHARMNPGRNHPRQNPT